MAVQFFKLVIKGTNKTKLTTIKNWFDKKIESNDLSDDVGNAKLSTSLYEELDAGNYIFVLGAYFKNSINKSKYKNIIVTQFTTLDKTGITHAYIDLVDNCTHDQAKPTPCVTKRVLEWTA